MSIITIDQINAAKGLLDWSFDRLAEASGVSKQTLLNIKSGKFRGQDDTLRKIRNCLESSGIELIEGGARWSQDIVKIYEGDDCYLRLLDDALLQLAGQDAEILFSGSDEQRSSNIVIEKLRLMRKAGIGMRSLIKDNDTFIMGDLNEYRWIDEALFTDSDVKVIYGDVTAYLMSWLHTPRVVAIRDQHIAEEATRVFEYLWGRSRAPDRTTSKIQY